MKRRLRLRGMARLLGALAKQVAVLIVLAVVVLLAVRVRQEKSPPKLEIWHTTELSGEFHASHPEAAPDFSKYLELEERLFQELDAKIGSQLPPDQQTPLNRYYEASASSPRRQDRDWNRSFVLSPPEPRGAMVLIHGLTECPYAMRTLAKIAFEHGYLVIAPRMPGHGTTPGSLARAKWEDWVAVVRIACEEARRVVGPGKPLILCGYSNGGLLSAKYALDELEKGGAGEPPQKLVLLSPAIGITQFAAVSGWHRALTVFPYFHKVAWLSIEPEYDPFKFNSFPKMAGDQIFRLTKVVERQMKDLEAGKGFARFPPVLAFTSVVDSTVLVPSLVDRLFSRLAANGSRLVLYDVNRCNAFAKFIKAGQAGLLASLESGPPLAYAVTVVTNRNPATLSVMAHERPAGASSWSDTLLELEWPRGVYSLSHVAVPFPPDDPVYGDREDLRAEGRLVLGVAQPRGENGVLEVPVSQFMRLRYNPFFAYQASRFVEFID